MWKKGSVSYDPYRNNFKTCIVTPLGRRIQGRFPTREQAEEWLAETGLALMRGTFIDPADYTVGEWVRIFIDVYCKPNVRAKTYVGYLQTAAHLEPIARIPLDKLAAPQVQAFYAELQDISSSYKFKIHRLLKAAVTKAAATDLIRKNPMLAVVPPRVQQKRISIFTKQEIARIMNFLKASRRDRLRMWPIVALALETGARLGEILGLKAGNVEEGRIRIEASVSDVLGRPLEQAPKTAAGRRAVAIAPQLERLLRSVIAEKRLAPNAYVFSAPAGGPLSTHNVERSWKRVLEQADVPYKKFHTLRHTNASMLLSAGVPLLEVSTRLGHSKPAHTLNLYGHAVPGKAAEVAAAAAAVMGTWG